MKSKFWTRTSRAERSRAHGFHFQCEPVEPRLLFATTPTVTGFTLINADTDQPISGVTLTDGAVLDLSSLPTKNLNVRADVDSSVASVKFGYDSNSNYRVESAAPFALASNNGLDYYAWTPTTGSHSLSATPYSATGATGTAGAKKTISFSVVNGGTTSSTVVNLMVVDGITREGDTHHPGTVLVTRNGSLSSALTVNLTVAGTATEGTDYDKLPRSVTIPAGSASATVTVTTVGDAITEPAETILVGLTSGSGYTIDSGTFPAIVTIPESDQPASARSFTTFATSNGTTGLNLTWTFAPTSTASYHITYTPGTYNGVTKSLDLPGTATSASLTGLSPFTLYSIDVVATDTVDGAKTSAHVNAWTAQQSTLKRYLYAVDAPKDRAGFTSNVAQIQVYDIGNNHAWVKNIPLPTGIYNIRGVAGSAVTDRLYVSYHTTSPDDDQPGGLLCIDLKTDALVWRKDYATSQVASPDRFDITPDGKKIYLPTGENGAQNKWAVVDAATGNVLSYVTNVSSPHNTIVSLDGRYAFLEGQEKGADASNLLHTVGMVDTTTNQVVRQIGPFRDNIRPFTINGKASLLFATVDNFIGFQVANVNTGKVLFTAVPPGITQPPAASHESYSHGISMTPDEKEVWVVDDGRAGFHVWNVEGVASGKAPIYEGFVQVRRQGRDMSGKTTSAANNDTIRAPRWLVPSYDGKYMCAEGGEIIDVATKTVVGQLRPMQKNSSGQLVQGPYAHSRFVVEVDFDNGAPVNVTDQFGIGHVR